MFLDGSYLSITLKNLFDFYHFVFFRFLFLGFLWQIDGQYTVVDGSIDMLLHTEVADGDIYFRILFFEALYDL